jgi:hypothetical protein
MANIKGQYLKRDLGDGTNVSLINTKRSDDGTFALAFRLRDGGRSVTLFLEDVDAVSYARELRDALTEYMVDRDAVEAEEAERRGKEHEKLKENRDKAKDKVTS